MRKILKGIGWFIFILLFIANCFVTALNYRNTSLLNESVYYAAMGGLELTEAGKINREMINSNQKLIKELIKKVAPDMEALEG